MTKAPRRCGEGLAETKNVLAVGAESFVLNHHWAPDTHTGLLFHNMSHSHVRG